MNAQRKKKLIYLLSVLSVLLVALLLILYALRQNISLFYTPEQISKHEVPENALVRIGGMVVKGSLARSDKSLESSFELTDFKAKVLVKYNGVLPTLFREGQGIVARGKLNQKNIFIAEEVLAKHDENYMPPEIKESLAANQQKRTS